TQHSQESYQEIYQRALLLFERGLFAEAETHFQNVIAQKDQNSSVAEAASFQLARTRIKLDSLSTDIYVEDFIREYPESGYAAELLTDLAHRHYKNGNLIPAITTYERALNYPVDSNHSIELYYWLAEASAEAGFYDESSRFYLTLADEHPRSGEAPRALFARGQLYLEQERYQESTRAFELLRARYPTNPITRRIGTALGESYYKQERFEDAIEAFQNAMPYLDSESRAKAVYLTAESYNALNQYEEATRGYLEYINRTDDEHEARIAHYGLGWVYHKQEIYHWAARSFGNASTGEDDLARKALYYKAVNEKLSGRYDQALESFREFGRRFQEGVFIENGYFEWAFTAFEMGRYAEAIEALLPLAREIESLENPGQILTFLGEAYFANGEYTRALQTFEIADEMADLDSDLKLQARFQKAWVQYSNQAYMQAQPDFERVYNEAPESRLGSEALFWSADAHYQMRNFGPAARQYSKFINENPNHELTGPAKYALGWSYIMMGDFENAIPPLDDFLNNYEPPEIALYPYETDTQLRIGDAYYAIGNYDKSLEYYRKAIGAEPGGDYAMFQVANSFYRMNRNFDAVSEFRRLLRIYPYSMLREQAQYNVAYIYLNTGNYDQAVEEFQTVINRFPATEWAARSQYNIGDAFYNAGDFEKAIEAYQSVLQNYPRSSYIIEAIDGIQFAQLSGGEGDTSTDVLEQFLANNPTSTTADRLRYRQAENLLQAGDYNAAVSEFRQYIRITNNQNLLPEAYFNLADAYQRTGSMEQAAEAYETIINDFSNSDQAPLALAELGRIRFEQGKYQDAERYFSRLAEQGTRYSQEANLGLGNVNLAMNQNSIARTHFEQVLASNPNNDVAKNGLAKILMNENKYEEARTIFREVVERSNTQPGAEAQYYIGKTFQQQGNFDNALEEYSRVEVLYEAFDIWVGEAQYSTAEIYIRQGRRGDAISLLNSIVEKFPGTVPARKAQRLLQNN
ncbi:MAG: tetratricopeptide repeat protein, partial [Balneolaceae bacterium]